MKKNNKGYSFVELIITMAIFSIVMLAIILIMRTSLVSYKDGLFTPFIANNWCPPPDDDNKKYHDRQKNHHFLHGLLQFPCTEIIAINDEVRYFLCLRCNRVLVIFVKQSLS